MSHGVSLLIFLCTHFCNENYSYQQLMRLEMPWCVHECVRWVQFNSQLHYHYTYIVHTVWMITIRAFKSKRDNEFKIEREKNHLTFVCMHWTKPYLLLLRFESNLKFHSKKFKSMGAKRRKQLYSMPWLICMLFQCTRFASVPRDGSTWFWNWSIQYVVRLFFCFFYGPFRFACSFRFESNMEIS